MPKPVEIKCEFRDVQPREITIQIGAPMNRVDIYAAFGLTKKGLWVLSVTWRGVTVEASCQQLDGDCGQYIYAFLMRRAVRVFDACGIDLPLVIASPVEATDETH